MELNPAIYLEFAQIHWFSQCGTDAPNHLPFPLRQVTGVSEAIDLARAENWRDAGTAAQGDLTSYLARQHPDAYGGHWNRLAKASLMPKVNLALARISAEILSDSVLLDLNRIALQSAYQRRFKRVPEFYERVFAIYQAGHLPCGWDGDIDDWPRGNLVIF